MAMFVVFMNPLTVIRFDYHESSTYLSSRASATCPTTPSRSNSESRRGTVPTVLPLRKPDV